MKLIKKIVPAICVLGSTLTIAPTIASCGDRTNIKIDQNEKTKYGSIFWREEQYPTVFRKTSYSATYTFELDDDIDDDDEIVVDSISSTSSTFKSVEKTDCKIGWMDEIVLLTVNFNSINGVQLKVGDTVSFKVVLKSKRGEVRKTTFDGLSLTMMDAPCDIFGDSIKDGLTGTAYPAKNIAVVDGFQIDNAQYLGTVTLLTSQRFESNDESDDAWLSFTFGSPIYPKLSTNVNAEVAVEAGFNLLVTKTKDTAVFNIPAGTEISVLFTPFNTQIIPYISTMTLDAAITATLEVK